MHIRHITFLNASKNFIHLPLFLVIIKQSLKASKRETHLKTSSSYRAFVDYDVDRTGVEAW
jgi:hypothetical protein